MHPRSLYDDELIKAGLESDQNELAYHLALLAERLIDQQKLHDAEVSKLEQQLYELERGL